MSAFELQKKGIVGAGSAFMAAALVVCFLPSPARGEDRKPTLENQRLQHAYRQLLEENERLKQALEAARVELATLKRSLQEPQRAVDYRKAIEQLGRAIEAKPGDGALYEARGSAYRQLGEYAKSIQDFSKAIDLGVSDASLYNERGTAYFLQSDLTQAREDFSRAIDLNPKLAEAYHNRGVIAFKQGDYPRAVKDLATARELGVTPAAQSLAAVKAEVTAIQRALEQLGFAPGPVDGIPGSKTVSAIRRLQEKAGLEATGRVDIPTRVALETAPLWQRRSLTTHSPRLFEKPVLEYPSVAKERGWEGTVTLSIELLKDGRVGEVKVEKSSGHSVLDQAAVESVKHWRHQPALENGVPVTRKINFDIEFRLDKKKAVGP